MMNDDYNFSDIEKKWQRKWEEQKIFLSQKDSKRKKFYCLEMYPYPSGRIHMGHVRNYSIGDVIARFKVMKGFNVIHPIGWDALGMPAENAAIQKGIHPQKWTLDNIAHMKQQLKKMGFNYDWSREVNTCLPDYYKWNQWIFLKMWEKGLAVRKKSWVNYCPKCRTVLANEQVIGDQCWRCESVVEQKEMEQWFLKITEYADELLSGHEHLEKWPEHVLTMQKNWIGRSSGVFINFPIDGSNERIEVFTTRIDTIYGATFLVLSPEHPLSRVLISESPEKQEKEEWLKNSIQSQHQRKNFDETEKKGIYTGKMAVNPFTHEKIPIWISDYVLMEYGTGAVMAVPAHDQRDFEFAQKYSLLIREVIVPEGETPRGELKQAYEEYGFLVNSGQFSGKSSVDAAGEMSALAETKGFGKKSVLFRLRDWGISRQRYWGTPIPVIYCEKCGLQPVPYEDLPVSLPFDVEFKGQEGSPLENCESFIHTKCPRCHGDARRETDTMDTFFDSSWYYFRYCSPHEESLPFDPESAKYWLPVDLYIGGVEHAILHLIYARFFCKVLRDLGLTILDEPFPHLLAQGMVLKDGTAMSKSKGNVVDPDEMITDYGADTLRLFILFASPPEKEFIWDIKGIEGSFRFLNRIWTFFQSNKELLVTKNNKSSNGTEGAGESALRLRRKMHQTIKKVTEDIENRFHLNTAISSIMEYFNQIKKESDLPLSSEPDREIICEAFEKLILLLSPFAPHICEEMWEGTGKKTMVSLADWPDFDPSLAKEETVTIVVQVNGKLRDRFEAERDLPEDRAKEIALGLNRIQEFIKDKQAKKIIYIKNKLVNIVV